MFMLLNQNVTFDQDFLVRSGLDGYLRLPMSNELIKVPDELQKALMDLLN
jgi:hypothetical protein